MKFLRLTDGFGEVYLNPHKIVKIRAATVGPGRPTVKTHITMIGINAPVSVHESVDDVLMVIDEAEWLQAKSAHTNERILREHE